MNKHCERYSGLIEDLVEGEFDEQRAAQAESHIFDCAKCRSEYELLRREKEVLGQYLFVFEPPPNSWISFQARLEEDEKKVSDNIVFPVELSRRKKRIFVFGFSPALAAAAALLLFFGIGFVALRNATFEKKIAEIKLKDSRQTPPQLIEDNTRTSPDVETNNVAVGETPNNAGSPLKNQSLKPKANFPFGKKPLVVETVKIKQKIVPPNTRKKPAGETLPIDEARTAMLRKQNLETEIAGQIEKIELLLRSFRNARAAENADKFDVEYEKRQARKLLETNAALRRNVETFGISYAEELLSRVEPYLLEIANLGNNPAPDKVLDIKERVSSQNIIANLQVYSSVAMAR